MRTIITLAQEAIRIFLNDFKVMDISDDLPAPLLTQTAGVFVSLHRPDGEMRGWGGTIRPIRANIAAEIVAAAIAAAFYSSSFKPITKGELSGLRIVIDIIENLTPASRNYKIDSWREGIMAETLDSRQGIILPGQFSTNNISELINIACRRGKINPSEENFKVFVFKTKRFSQ